ncbi:unnamed protein product [Acanthoscelides obtectus]|uniref:Uncharacterized protein n=1 Tax=Acanthoscelides obtectus TaxID=200917 RepID=A0A9P0M038_ACAOB|nr:unnamed protein product [Acanthoscelides obtectus]CAK1638934.1 hypothetical protein AOBTE_LOCUS10893 [Acanthoscelides obtectus]
MNIDSYRTIIYCGTNDTLQAYKHIRISYKYYRNGYLLRWCEHVLERITEIFYNYWNSLQVEERRYFTLFIQYISSLY